MDSKQFFCARCQKYKDKKSFYLRKSGHPLSYCIECQEKVKRLKFEEKIETLAQIYGGMCHDCQITYPATVYEFYSDGKVFSIGKAKNMSLQRLIKELKGYIMVCRNCSAVRTWEKS